MGKILLKKTASVLNDLLSTLAEFGKGASYALRH
ncbi:conserved hypothetical protein [Tenacibaculum sp. 190130A14a]|uniref:Uncharacterized protein n=1 Tax=Tenacibaculum polynesiense TaxID=3137857 RepID=A0ABP1F690_9FLAO